MKKIIYDFGASEGENIPYYLLKSDLIIAVEANQKSCEIIKQRFYKEIREKKFNLDFILKKRFISFAFFFFFFSILIYLSKFVHGVLHKYLEN